MNILEIAQKYENLWSWASQCEVNKCVLVDFVNEAKGYSMTVEQVWDKDEVETMLRTGLSQIEFMKLDGTLRVMIVTKDPSIIPKEHQPTETSKRVKSSSTVTVYDVENSAWKSFVLENLIMIDKE